MAEEAKKKADAPAPAHGEKGGDKKEAGKGGLLSKTPVLLGGAMVIEAIVLFAGFKFLGSGAPKQAAGAELVAGESGGEGGEHGEGGAAPTTAAIDKNKSVEVQIVDFRAPNKQSGRMFLYDVTIFAETKAEYESKVKEIITEREALIKD